MTETAIAFGGAAFVGRRCDPYGAESGGPKRVLGGLHGPNSARVDTDDMPGLPQSVIEGEWACRQLAQVRVRMVCRCQHTGAIMELCSWHDEDVFSGEYVAGKMRRIRTTKRVHGHYEEISRRQAGACPRCLYPGGYADQYKALFAWQQELAMLRENRMWYSTRAQYCRGKIEDICGLFDAGNATGQIHRCPMTLEPVS
jgi:hypothetical protein